MSKLREAQEFLQKRSARLEIRPDGSLFDLGWYLQWDASVPKEVILDGDFTSADLRAIADCMDLTERPK